MPIPRCIDFFLGAINVTYIHNLYLLHLDANVVEDGGGENDVLAGLVVGPQASKTGKLLLPLAVNIFRKNGPNARESGVEPTDVDVVLSLPGAVDLHEHRGERVGRITYNEKST